MSKLPKVVRNSRVRDIALLIQKGMRAKGIEDIKALVTVMGLRENQYAAVNNWVTGRNGVSVIFRDNLAATLGIPAERLVSPPPAPRTKPDAAPPAPPWEAEQVPAGPAQRAVVLAKTARHNGELVPPPPPVNDVLTIRARSDGTMGIKLDASLDYGRGVQLVQFLLSFGLVIGTEDQRQQE